MMTNLKCNFALIFLLFIANLAVAQNKILVFQSDFGLKDGAVSAMKGVAIGVSSDLKIFDLTHEIPAYNIWEAAYRLVQTVPYYPAGTVFVSVVDPGVGTARKSVVLKTKTGQFIVTPDNGTLTLVAQSLGIEAVREINEVKNRRKDSEKSYTFHGRDVYAYTGAKLASGVITYDQVGAELPKQVVEIPYQKATLENGVLKGSISILDVQYGNIWTDISGDLVKQLNPEYGDVLHGHLSKRQKKFMKECPIQSNLWCCCYRKTLSYLNSLLQLSFALKPG